MKLYRIDTEQPIYDSDLIASYARMDGELDEWIGALVEVRPCAHGNYAPHTEVLTYYSERTGATETLTDHCPGSEEIE